jgi:serine/threonine-protein kinase
MRFEDLSQHLTLDRVKLDELFETFRSAFETEDLGQFLAFLYQHDHIDGRTLGSLYMLDGVEIVNRSATREAPVGDIPGYALQGMLGKGAQGEIYLAKDTSLRRKVAVKRMMARDPNAADRFHREVLITAQLDHPNIVPVYHLDDTSDGGLAYSMKLIGGHTLTRLLDECRERMEEGLPPTGEHGLSRRLEVFLKVCDALAYAHRRNVIHRDLKPDNIMIGPFGEVYVMDWGVARRLDSEAEEQGTLVGTLAYMAPEQCRGGALDPTADQYALGLILFEVVTLTRAMTSEKNMPSMLLKVAQGKRRPMVHHDPSIPIRPELKAIVHKATSIDPAERYADVEAMAEDVRSFLRGDAVSARPDTTWQAALRWVTRHRELTLVMFLLVLLGGLGSMTWGLYRQQVLREEARVRELALSEVLNTISDKANNIDQDFLRYEGLLRSLAAAAETSLQAGIQNVPSYLDLHFDDPAKAPPGTTYSSAYGYALNTEWPVFRLAPGTDASTMEDTIGRLVRLRGPLRNTLLRSHRDEATTFDAPQARALIAEQGTPIVWAFVATEDGVHTAYPGKGGYPPDYDPRARPWYKLSAGTHGPRCGNPYLDAMGQGLLLPCSTSLYDADGRLLGVAGLEFTFRFIIGAMMDLPGLEGVRESVVLDEEGRVVLRSGHMDTRGDKPQLAVDQSLERAVFEVQPVVDSVRKGRSGYLELEERSSLLVWYRMNALGWYYTVIGDAGRML